MKHLILSVLLSYFMTVAHSQTVSPSISNEYCPNTEYTFTVSISKTYSSMIGEGGCFLTQSPAFPVGNTFTFKGKFGDLNQKQTFRIYHTDGTSTPFEFKKIKSLFYGPCSPVSTPATVTAAPCQVVSIPINFSAVQWKTELEPFSTACYGSISTYEYQLPANWSLNGTPSTGNNWIIANNSVTVISDANTGGVIKVRPSNNCGTGLSNNSPISTISILRPKPPVTFTSTNPICNNATYTAANIPSVFTNVNWTTSPAGLVSLGSPNASTTAINKLTTGVGTINFNITAPGCSTFSYNTQEITGIPELIVGAPTNITDLSIQALSNDCYLPIERYTAIGGTGATTYKWYYRRLPNFPFTLKQSGSSNAYDVTGGIPGSCIDIQLKVEASNACNANTPILYTMTTDQCRCTKEEALNGFRLTSVTPNPSSSTIQIDLLASYNTKKELKEIRLIKIIDKIGNTKKEITGNKLRKMLLNISDLKSDVYTISIFDGRTWSSQRFTKL